jgi:hypothetical protein
MRFRNTLALPERWNNPDGHGQAPRECPCPSGPGEAKRVDFVRILR